jgi:DNA-binding response OmpR family regulator
MRILIVEDERDLADMLAAGLRREGMLVNVAYDGQQGLDLASDYDPDVIVLDRDLPVLHGDDVCRRLLEWSHPARILMLTAAGEIGDVVSGLSRGADDYLRKPFSYLELLARIEALGRRSPNRGEGVTQPTLERSGVRLDARRGIVEREGIPLQLTPKEFGVLRAIMQADGAFRTPTQLLDEVWEDSFARTTDVVKVVIHSLRTKLVDRSLIEMVPGFGYRMR